MKISFDPAKDEANIAKHGLSFSDFPGFDSLSAAGVDDRKAYGETRFRAFGRVNGLGFSIAYAATEDGIRLISFRRAREKEMRRYE